MHFKDADDDISYKSDRFRKNVIEKIERALRVTGMEKYIFWTSIDLEEKISEEASSLEHYMTLVVKCIREIEYYRKILKEPVWPT
ncbi:unnamed protein product [Brassicogethes aeneus]|uniref:Mediator of RNA polymerase II transcription subunit 15 n=1 Tax=Brassicogethes aeneus TaxID=1431903 RepID=A0A9P0FIU7_BRAAE|nr:unnamed protein product [Brassicogethes aeneus]